MPASAPSGNGKRRASAQAATVPSLPANMVSQASSAPKQKNLVLFAGVAGAALALVVLLSLILGGKSTGSLAVGVSSSAGKEVSGVHVFVDGAEACANASVCEVEELEVGSHKVKATAKGFADSTLKLVTIEAGKAVSLNLELDPDSAETGLRFKSSMKDLTLSVDGKSKGDLPDELLNLKAGSYDIVITGNKFLKPFQKKITLKQDEIVSIEPEFELESAEVTIELGENAKGAKMYLKGGKKTAPLHNQGLPKKFSLDPSKSYRVVASRKGYEDFEENLEFSVSSPQASVVIDLVESEDAEEEEKSKVVPVARPRSTNRPVTTTPKAPKPPAATAKGKLNINSIPVSRVLLDGRPLGTTPKFGVSVSPGSHTVLFVYKGARQTKRVNVKAGGTATAAVRFK
jgi:serine/threonine-protein kinase